MFLLLWVPGSVFAAVEITEVMYDVEGSDSGREWVEITNTGASAVLVGGYKLFENDTNHKLMLISGSETLAPGGSAIIAAHPEKFKLDWPAFAGTVFDSAFALVNTGETLVLKDEKLQAIDSVSYSSSMGAKGEGSSLHKDGATFVAALPNPGVHPGELKKKVVAKPSGPATSASASNTTTNVKKAVASSTSSSDMSAVVTLGDSQTSNNLGMLAWGAGLLCIITLGVAGALFARQERSQKNETTEDGEEFKLIDN